MSKFQTVVFLVAAFAIAQMANAFWNVEPWQGVVVGLGGTLVEDSAEGLPCATFGSQLICYQVFDTWYGEDAVPAFVVENGVCTTIYGACPK